MPPARTKKDRVSGPTKTVAIQSPNTPIERESRQQAPSITEAQKQALIDNLQLEITERARKLRAQYGLHAQGLKSRLEMRINRIPQSLRTVNIEDLIDKYATNLDPPPAQALPPAYKPAFSRTNTANSKESVVMTSSPMRKGLKRDSSDMMGQSDKENAGADLDLPKKRARTANNTLKPSGAAQTRPVSRKVDPSKVLSPKSHNSRTYPQSPVKPFSPAKSALARPVSPIKPGTVAAATASLASLVSNTSTKTGSIRGKLARANMAPPPVPAKRGRPASQSSQTSDSSAQTTIVKRPGVVRKAVSKATGMTAAATGRTKAVGRKEIPAPSATGTGGRTLRSRR